MNITKFAGTLVIQNGKILLVQEAHKEALGLWSLPIGHVETGEEVAQTALRETKEETGYDVSLGTKRTLEVSWQDLRSTSDFDNFQIDLTIFDATITSGDLLKGNDVLDARWFDLGEVENLPLRGEWVKHFIFN